MKTLTFNRKSWHAKLAKVAGYDFYHGDVCSYTRHVLGGSLLAAFLAAAAFVVSFLAIHMLLGIAFSLWYGIFLFTDAGVFGLMIGSVIGLITAAHYLNEKLKERRWETRNKPDGFVKNAYRGWKDKYCTKIEFRDEDEQDDNLRAGN